MVEILTSSVDASSAPEKGLKALQAESAFDSKKTGSENLVNLVRTVTRNGAPITPEEKSVLVDMLRENDKTGYFKEKPDEKVMKLLNTIGSVQLSHGMVRFADKAGAFNRGGFQLKEYGTSDNGLDVATQQAIDSADTYVARHAKNDRMALSFAIENTTAKKGFRAQENGSYEIGSTEKPTKIPESGKDFYRLTRAEKISIVSTAFGSEHPLVATAHWVKERNQYEYDDTTDKVVLEHNHEYVLTPVQEGAKINTFTGESAKKAAARRKLDQVSDEQVSTENPERILDRSRRFAWTLNNFLDKDYINISHSIIPLAEGEWRPREVLKYDMYNKPVYAPEVTKPEYKHVILEDLSSVLLTNKTDTSYKAQVKLVGRGTFTVETNKDGNFSVSQNGNALLSYDAKTDTVTGNFSGFTQFADRLGNLLARSVNDYNDPSGYWRTKRDENKRRRQSERNQNDGLNS